VGLIQLAVAQYHYRRGNDIGAKKLLIKSINILKQRKMELTKLGIDIDSLFVLLENLQTSYINGCAYKNINLPICNQHLLHVCKKESVQSGLNWCSDDIISNFIVHRHLYKNRVDVDPAEKSRIYEKIKNNA